MVNASSRLFVPLLVMHMRDTSCRLTFQLASVPHMHMRDTSCRLTFQLARSDKQFCLLAATRFLVN